MTIRKLNMSELKVLRESNEARSQLGLELLDVKVRTCLQCRRLFESIGRRSCGCMDQRPAFTWTVSGNDDIYEYGGSHVSSKAAEAEREE